MLTFWFDLLFYSQTHFKTYTESDLCTAPILAHAIMEATT